MRFLAMLCLVLWFPVSVLAVNLGCTEEERAAQQSRISEFLADGGRACESDNECAFYAYVPFCQVAVAKGSIERLKELYVTPRSCDLQHNHCLLMTVVPKCKNKVCELERTSAAHNKERQLNGSAGSEG